MNSFDGLKKKMRGQLPAKQVVVPRTLTWDKLVALYIYVVLVLKLTLEDVVIKFDDDYTGVDEIPEHVIDIDVRSPYHETTSFGSATERIVRRFKPMEIGLEFLVGAINDNNSFATIKHMSDSFIQLIRNLYEVRHSTDQRTHRLNVIKIFWPVVEMYFAAMRRDFQKTLERLNHCNDVFTLNGYPDLMRLAGNDQPAIDAACETFKVWFDKAKKRNEESKRRAESIKATLFNVNRYGGHGTVTAHLIHSDDNRIAMPYLQLHPEVSLFVIRQSSGHYRVFGRGIQDFRPLFHHLDCLEPDRWHLLDPVDERTGKRKPAWVMNGGPGRTRPASEVRPARIIELVQRYCKYLSRSQQQRYFEERDRWL